MVDIGGVVTGTMHHGVKEPEQKKNEPLNVEKVWIRMESKKAREQESKRATSNSVPIPGKPKER
ncbi:hypothetical protein BPOR_0463g00060 [Botrytis porri]|uniref:Uncharacterized protein n=1 Tax=Botrytis porri TaxID=87229 RepID=A0A4Z1KGZ5_9HELO|nr:hypothetical protein BPOR_0463g00060 [Botrytis porri]